MNTLELTNQLKEARKNNLPFKVFKGIMQESPTWNQFLNYVEKTKEFGNYRSDREGFYILNSTEISYISDFPNIKNFYNAILSAYGKELVQKSLSVILSETYRNIAPISGVARHSDPIDTIHWAAIGASMWKLWDSEGNLTEILLEPGDIIYVKDGNEHEVESITPRAGIIFTAGEGYDPNKNE